jgi:CDP-paratose 2-epimerase
MKIAITGICGFVGASIARRLLETTEGLEICGIDNLLRPGSESNRTALRALGVQFVHGDVRMASDLDLLPAADWVIDAAANPSVLAGTGAGPASRQLMEHNLLGTVNVLEWCRKSNAGFLLLSSSRVYSIPPMASLPLRTKQDAFELDDSALLPPGVSAKGLAEDFSVQAPVSLYGATKLASETLALEYGQTFGFPVWVTRCGVLAGAGQFGTAEQGIFSYWLHAHASRKPLRYIGFGGRGFQVRDAFHPHDLADLLRIQMQQGAPDGVGVWNAGGGAANAMSLAQLTAWCDDRFGAHAPSPDTRPRPFDIPWLIMDSTRVGQSLGWSPHRSLGSILDEIAVHVRENPHWLERCGVA